MKTKLENLNNRLAALRVETNVIRSELFKLATEIVKSNQKVSVPVNPIYAKKESLSDEEKLYSSVLLDSFPAEYKNENGVVRDTYILSVSLNNEGELTVRGYAEGTGEKKGVYKYAEFPADELVNVEPLVSFLLAFATDANEPEK